MYKVFDKLGIPFERVDNDPASSMEECRDIGKVLGAPVRKDVFLCNRKKTTFFLLVMPEEKDFDASSFSKKLGVSHMSLLHRSICGSIWEQNRDLQVLSDF